MTGFESKRQMAQAKLDDDTQVYADTLTIVYQRGFADGKAAAERNRGATTHCQCAACKNGNIHDSDCSVHNGDALPVGPCDCSLATPPVQPAERKPLTEPVIGNMMPSQIPMEYDGPLMEFARAVEAAHNIKEQL